MVLTVDMLSAKKPSCLDKAVGHELCSKIIDCIWNRISKIQCNGPRVLVGRKKQNERNKWYDVMVQTLFQTLSFFCN